ncbi:MAG TPA: DUF5668 domain-containing protein [Candidatus Acidoferrales bacterium]|nr:DUF5668 domain-containing protein [Candidatus Acidoferrales bacterium]
MRDNRSLVCAIRGPVTLITLGVLFALNNFTPFGFDKTWPVLLIVFGLLSLMRRGLEPVTPPASVPPSGFPPPNFPPPAYTAPGSYSHSTYAQPGPAKGGFGGSAPSKSETGPDSTPKGDTV